MGVPSDQGAIVPAPRSVTQANQGTVAERAPQTGALSASAADKAEERSAEALQSWAAVHWAVESPHSAAAH